jgi:hypothetical protein
MEFLSGRGRWHTVSKVHTCACTHTYMWCLRARNTENLAQISLWWAHACAFYIHVPVTYMSLCTYMNLYIHTWSLYTVRVQYCPHPKTITVFIAAKENSDTNAYMYTHTHILNWAFTYTYWHTHTHTHSPTYSHIYTDIHIHTYIQEWHQTDIHTRTHTRRHTHTHILTYTYIHTYRNGTRLTYAVEYLPVESYPLPLVTEQVRMMCTCMYVCKVCTCMSILSTHLCACMYVGECISLSKATLCHVSQNRSEWFVYACMCMYVWMDVFYVCAHIYVHTCMRESISAYCKRLFLSSHKQVRRMCIPCSSMCIQSHILNDVYTMSVYVYVRRMYVYCHIYVWRCMRLLISLCMSMYACMKICAHSTHMHV